MNSKRSRWFAAALATLQLVLFAVPIGADSLDTPAPVTWGWSAPPDGAPVHHYEVELSVNDGPWVLQTSTTGTVFTLTEIEYMNLYEIRVRAFTADNLFGPYSDESEPFVRDIPEPPRPPGS